MIKILDKKTQMFLDYLQKTYPLKEEVKMIPLWGWDAVQSNDSNQTGFAVYDAVNKIIMLPMEIPEVILETKDQELIETFIIHNLAHEYKHALQHEGGLEYTPELEKEADNFADEVVFEFIKNFSEKTD